jgi:hypothetical protein
LQQGELGEQNKLKQIKEEMCPVATSVNLKEPRKLERAIVKISIVPMQSKDENDKKPKPRIKFDLNGFSAYLPSNLGGGGRLVDEPTMLIKVLLEKES